MKNAMRCALVGLVGLSALLTGCQESPLTMATGTGFAVAGVAGAQYAAPLLPGGFVAAKPAVQRTPAKVKAAARGARVAQVLLADRIAARPLTLPPVPAGRDNGGFPPGSFGPGPELHARR